VKIYLLTQPASATMRIVLVSFRK